MFLVLSNEKLPCPYCGGKLLSRDSRLRKLIHTDGSSRTLRIRRLLCKSCGKLHAELPDIIQPFKHYASEVIQQALDGDPQKCPAENSTIRRWIREFTDSLEALDCSLIALWMHENRKSWNLLKRISLLCQIKEEHPDNWYAFVTRRLINSGFAPHTRFAFCPPGGYGKLSPTQLRKGNLP